MLCRLLSTFWVEIAAEGSQFAAVFFLCAPVKNLFRMIYHLDQPTHPPSDFKFNEISAFFLPRGMQEVEAVNDTPKRFIWFSITTIGVIWKKSKTTHQWFNLIHIRIHMHQYSLCNFTFFLQLNHPCVFLHILVCVVVCHALFPLFTKRNWNYKKLNVSLSVHIHTL